MSELWPWLVALAIVLAPAYLQHRRNVRAHMDDPCVGVPCDICANNGVGDDGRG